MKDEERRESFKWIGQLAAWEAYDLVPAFPGMFLKSLMMPGSFPFPESTVVEMRPY